ncbi:cytochrome c biogenesis protein [Methanococcoides burtonii]|uniref:ABC transporter, permease component n=1 Tax=Methanococcoides burtonii (strain DSM 6242 / NBRC 107633 / OCM 468 / ACE-M) TaxID=259564 RepID=Q12XA5_METBU|nr:cytochrome c biogenesis protein [Methanococcoides burtonii]ABE51921.1 ABC transporter, permease component [Methanococcoides burtonii DSM 6242]
MSESFLRDKFLPVLSATTMLLAIGMIIFYLPDMKGASGETLDMSFRIFYFHMPIAITSYLAFTVIFFSSILFLRTGKYGYDILSRSASEVGVIFAFLVLATGSIWARATWGWYWVWEPRLTTSLALFLVYVAYIVLRQAVDGVDKRARLASVFGILGFISVPLSFLSIRLWRSAHPLMFGDTSGSGGGGLEGTSLQLTLLVNVIAFTLLFITLVVYKMRNEQMEERADEIRASLD